MAGMERFTQRARRVLSLAHQEAEHMRHHHITRTRIRGQPGAGDS